jgi:hypothetical protein
VGTLRWDRKVHLALRFKRASFGMHQCGHIIKELISEERGHGRDVSTTAFCVGGSGSGGAVHVGEAGEKLPTECSTLRRNVDHVR